MKIRADLLAEFVGTAGLLMVVVGSGIMAENLSGGNQSIALLANAIATGAGLYALIQTFGSFSGAHFNPAVSLIEWFWKRLSTRQVIGYILVQISGAIVGVWISHFLFQKTILQLSQHDRSEFRLYVSEFVATWGLLVVIALSGRKQVKTTPAAVSLFITSAYWFTSSTSFANPAVTIARSMTDTFSGVLWTAIPGFVIAQIAATFFAYWFVRVLLHASKLHSS